MRQRIGWLLSYSNVMATAAVFIALGGGAYAVSLKRNSVGSKQIKANAVKGSEAKESTFGIVPNAGKLDGIDSTGFARTGSPPWREVAAQPSSFGDCGLILCFHLVQPQPGGKQHGCVLEGQSRDSPSEGHGHLQRTLYGADLHPAPRVPARPLGEPRNGRRRADRGELDRDSEGWRRVPRVPSGRRRTSASTASPSAVRHREAKAAHETANRPRCRTGDAAHRS